MDKTQLDFLIRKIAQIKFLDFANKEKLDKTPLISFLIRKIAENSSIFLIKKIWTKLLDFLIRKITQIKFLDFS